MDTSIYTSLFLKAHLLEENIVRCQVNVIITQEVKDHFEKNGISCIWLEMDRSKMAGISYRMLPIVKVGVPVNEKQFNSQYVESILVFLEKDLNIPYNEITLKLGKLENEDLIYPIGIAF